MMIDVTSLLRSKPLSDQPEHGNRKNCYGSKHYYPMPGGELSLCSCISARGCCFLHLPAVQRIVTFGIGALPKASSFPLQVAGPHIKGLFQRVGEYPQPSSNSPPTSSRHAS